MSRCAGGWAGAAAGCTGLLRRQPPACACCCRAAAAPTPTCLPGPPAVAPSTPSCQVIDRVLFRLDELVRPYCHKILVVIEPLLIDEDYYARVEGR